LPPFADALNGSKNRVKPILARAGRLTASIRMMANPHGGILTLRSII
jgi:hypothetical protein